MESFLAFSRAQGTYFSLFTGCIFKPYPTSSHLAEFKNPNPSKVTTFTSTQDSIGKLTNPPRKREWLAIITIRRDIPSKGVSIFKRLKMSLGKQLVTITSLKTILVLLTLHIL